MKKIINKKTSLLIGLGILLLPLTFLTSCSNEKIFSKLSDFDGTKLGCITGQNADKEFDKTGKVKDYTWSYRTSSTDLINDLKNNNIDGFTIEYPMAQYISNNESKIHLVSESVTESKYAYIVNKNNSSLKEHFNNALTSLTNRGKIIDLESKWFNNRKGKDVVCDTPIIAENPVATIKYYYYLAGNPSSYLDDNNKLTGFDYDLLINLCNEASINIEPVESTKCLNLSNVIESVKNEPNSIGGSCITINDELKSKVDFTDSYLDGGLRVISRAPSYQITTKEEIDKKDKIVGILQGGIGEAVALQNNMQCMRKVYPSFGDCTQALLSGKIDGYFADEPKAIFMIKRAPQLTYIKERYFDDKYGFVFQKGNPLRDEFDIFFQHIKTNGDLAKLKDHYFGTGTKFRDIVIPKNPKRTITYSTNTNGGEPFNYYKNNEILGYEVDLCRLFCEYNGYGLIITDSSGMGAIDNVTQGKADLSGNCISYTEERMKSVDYTTEPTLEGGYVMAVRDFAAPANEKGFFERIGDAFVATFGEGRWLMFLNGIGTTILITVISIIVGGVIGFLLFTLLKRSNNNKVFDKVLKAATWLITAMPVVVLLLIFNYLIFASARNMEILISCVVFSLIFMCSTLSLLRLGTNAVDKGQEEAATALGYSRMGTFFKIILPQATRHILPPLKGEVTSLIKATAIVGYISVSDLTKVADIIRSQTFEAFVPLIVVAIVYILFGALASFIVKKINIQIDPKHRKTNKILKGIEEHD